MHYEDYRREIYVLDSRIANATDPKTKIELIDQNISLNEEYIKALKKPLAVKIVFCILLSFIYLIGLMIFLPQIIIRKNRIAACEQRIESLKAVRKDCEQQL